MKKLFIIMTCITFIVNFSGCATDCQSQGATTQLIGTNASANNLSGSTLCAKLPEDYCGDNTATFNELCDGTKLPTTESCVTQGFTGGTLACASDCLSFDTSQCY